MELGTRVEGVTDLVDPHTASEMNGTSRPMCMNKGT